MKKIIFSFLFSFITLGVFCQDSVSISESDMFSVDILYGSKLFKSNFYSSLNTFNDFNISNPIQLIGVGISGAYMRTGAHEFALHHSYSQVIPQQVIIKDSVLAKINGFILSIDVYGYDFFSKSKNANMILSGGFNTGRLRLNGEQIKQKNPFFSPRISLQPKFKIKHFVFSVRGDYEFDISKKNWRKTSFSKNNQLDVNTFKSTGLTCLLSLGWAP